MGHALSFFKKKIDTNLNPALRTSKDFWLPAALPRRYVFLVGEGNPTAIIEKGRHWLSECGGIQCEYAHTILVL